MIEDLRRIAAAGSVFWSPKREGGEILEGNHVLPPLDP